MNEKLKEEFDNELIISGLAYTLGEYIANAHGQ